jgi:hypothetical protein
MADPEIEAEIEAEPAPLEATEAPPAADSAPAADATVEAGPEADAEAPDHTIGNGAADTRRDPSGPIPLPGSDDGGPPTQGMPIPLADLEDGDEGDDDVPSLRPPEAGRTIDVREVRARHTALDSAAEGDPFLTELRRAVVDDDDDEGPGPRDALEKPDLVDADVLPERRLRRRRRPAV